jgi:hypothetical protein
MEEKGKNPVLVEKALQDIQMEIDKSTLPANEKQEIARLLELMGKENTVVTKEEVPEEEVSLPTEEVVEEPKEEAPTEEEIPVVVEKTTKESTPLSRVLGVFFFVFKLIGIIFAALLFMGMLLYATFVLYKKRSGKDELDFEDFMLNIRTYVKELFAKKEKKPAGEAQYRSTGKGGHHRETNPEGRVRKKSWMVTWRRGDECSYH